MSGERLAVSFERLALSFALVLGMDVLELGHERRSLSSIPFWLYLATPNRSFAGLRRV